MKYTVIGLALLCFAILLVSQTPNNTGAAKNKGGLGEGIREDIEKEQQNAAGSPSEVIAVYNQKTAPEHDGTASQHEEDVEIQRKLAKYTKALVWVGIVQAVVLWGTLLAIWRQARLMKVHADHLEKLVAAADDNARAAKDGAYAASKNAEFSKLNAEATKESATAAKISAEAARDSITLTHRPKLVLREIYMFPPATSPNVTINYSISNCGSTTATIIESLIDVQPIASGIVEPLREDGLNMIGDNVDNVLAYPEKSLIIESGAFRRYRYSSEVPHQLLIDSHFAKDNIVPRPRLFFRGRVVYRDELGTKRQMAFCRYYDFQAHRFSRLGDPDYEYED